MERFKDIESLYKHLENNAFEYRYLVSMAELFQALRDNKHEEGNSDEAEKAQIELDALEFTTRDGELLPKLSGTNDKGEEVNYPDISSFKEKAFTHLIRRTEETLNPRLKSRYSHILWKSKKKDIRYAKVAVDSYLSSIKIFEDKDKEKPADNYGLELLAVIKNGFFIGCPIRYRVNDIKSEIVRLIKEFNNESRSRGVLVNELINLMLDSKKVFSKEDFIGLDRVCDRTYRLREKESNYDRAVGFLELGERIDRKLGKKSMKWRRKIASLHERMFLAAEKRSDFSALFFYQSALDNYRILRDDKKIAAMERRYKELKSSLPYKEFKQETDLSKTIKRSQELAEKIISGQKEKLIPFLMLEKRLLPTYKGMERWANRNEKEVSIIDFIPEVVMDPRGHPAKHYDEKEEKKEYRILQNYGLDLWYNKIFLIREIFIRAIRERALTKKAMLEFLERNTWLGKNISKKVPQGEIVVYNWLNMIAPAINDYFNNVDMKLLSQNYRPNFVLSIDSLAMKIEGLLRDICELSNIPTSHHRKDKKGRSISSEKDLGWLLNEKIIKEMFDEDDLLFLKYLLVEQAGLNIRHKVAHSLMAFQEYRFDTINLLILALLRLGKYDLVKAN